MKLFVIFFLIAFLKISSYAQKPPLDLNSVQHFSELGSAIISNDGKYTAYTVECNGEGATLHLRAIAGSYSLEIKKLPQYFNNFSFTEDGHQFVFLRPGDSLGVMNLRKKKLTYISNCRSFKIPQAGESNLIACQQSNEKLLLYDPNTARKDEFENVSDYVFTPSGKAILLKQRLDSQNSQLSCFDLNNKKKQIFWTGKDATNITFDQSSSQMAFFSAGTDAINTTYEIWRYRIGTDSAEKVVYEKLPGFNSNLTICNFGLHFNKNGDKLFFYSQKKRPEYSLKDEFADVDVWNYKDKFLLTEQQRVSGSGGSAMWVYNIATKNVLQLRTEELIENLELNAGANDDYALGSSVVNYNEEYYRNDQRADIFIINTTNGSRTCIQPQSKASPFNYKFSHHGKYVIWFENDENAYYTYNLNTGTKTNISKLVTTPLSSSFFSLTCTPKVFGIAMWTKEDATVVVYDEYDIWELDPQGEKPPRNLTNGYGRDHHISFRLLQHPFLKTNYKPEIKKGATIYLSAFSEITKDNGFFLFRYGTNTSLQKLILEPAVYFNPDTYGDVFFIPFLGKAKNAHVFLVKKESPTEPANLFTTTDFKHFTTLSDLAPQKEYNWLTAELIAYKTFDGKQGKAILYKPENFDSTKKYPVIFYIYDRITDGLNKFQKPGLSTGTLNIPYFVSNGYLVCSPDIFYTVGEPSKSVHNYVTSAAIYLSKMPWVLPEKIGIQGHSFGGYEVNSIITRTNIFAAAESGAGNSNLISAAGNIAARYAGYINVEKGQYRMGLTLSDDKDGYIDNSPVLNASKVTTPLLIMHNKGDGNVAWPQSIEYFLALRRLQKPVWMLQYDNEYHSIEEPKNQVDFTIRLQQFFDHYLKNSPPPKWMTQGIPAALKKIDDGLQLEFNESCGKDCKVCKGKNEKSGMNSASASKKKME